MIWIILWFSLLATTVFFIQFFLCLKANKKVVKLIPPYVIVALYIIAAVLCLIDMLNGSGGVAIWMIFAFIISISNTVALAADIIAWVTIKQIKKK